LEFLLHFNVVVNFAIVNDPVSTGGVAHRLVPCRTEIDDGQAAVAQPRGPMACALSLRFSARAPGAVRTKKGNAFIVRPAMGNKGDHGLEAVLERPLR